LILNRTIYIVTGGGGELGRRKPGELYKRKVEELRKTGSDIINNNKSSFTISSVHTLSGKGQQFGWGVVCF